MLVNAVLHDFTIGALLHVPYGKILESTASEAVTLAVCLDYLAFSVHTTGDSQRVMKTCSNTYMMAVQVLVWGPTSVRVICVCLLITFINGETGMDPNLLYHDS